jgi:hypothetical protein
MLRTLRLALLALALTACDSAPPPITEDGGASPLPDAEDEPTGPPPELGEPGTRQLTVVGTAADGLAHVRDLWFPPGHPDQLWTFNAGIHGTVIYFQPGTPQQTVEKRVDRYAEHFMDTVSSAAFGADPGANSASAGTFATCQESRDDWNDAPQPEDDFMGPTLWTDDLSIYCKVGQEFPYVSGHPEGSHLDMLHQSPLCMGIAHDHDNVYWAFDGQAGNLVSYDFRDDHGPGGSSHADGVVRRYVDTHLTRVAGVPGHMAMDRPGGLLYIADTGSGRVMRFDTATGTPGSAIDSWDGGDYRSMKGGSFTPFVSGLGQPSGLFVDGKRVFVADHASGDIVVFDTGGHELGRLPTGAPGVMGIRLGPDHKLWFVDGDHDRVVRVDP